MLLEEIDELLLGLAIGNHSIKQRQRPNTSRPGLGKLAVVGHQDLLLRHSQCLVLHFQLIKVEAGRAVPQVDARRRDKGNVWADAIQLVMLTHGGKDVVIRLELAAAQDHLAVGFIL